MIRRINDWILRKIARAFGLTWVGDLTSCSGDRYIFHDGENCDCSNESYKEE